VVQALRAPIGKLHFRRQHAIDRYVVDFCASRQKLVVEVDGSQHQDQEEYDRERTLFLESRGCQVIRFWNHEVLADTDAVVLAILHVLQRD
jgi:very-short-patch-repair endonuclease